MEADENAWMRWVTRYTLKRSAYFTSDPNVTREKAIAFGADSEKTVIFPWGTDIEHFTPKTFKRSNVKTFTLFCSRTWESIYGVDVLAKAFVKVAGEHPNVNLILLGGGSQGLHIRQILMSGGVMDRVHFGGQVGQRDLPRWYHMADLYISPSHVDGSSVTLMEALASGLPCLVSDIPGNKEWIEDGVNGWLFRDLLKPVAPIVTLVALVLTWNNFQMIWVLTEGGPAYATSVLATYVYTKGFVFFQLGSGSAVATLSILVILVVCVIYARTLRLEEREP